MDQQATKTHLNQKTKKNTARSFSKSSPELGLGVFHKGVNQRFQSVKKRWGISSSPFITHLSSLYNPHHCHEKHQSRSVSIGGENITKESIEDGSSNRWC